MAERLSTGLRNYLLGHGSMRRAFIDAKMVIYSGSAPAEADDAVSGVLLVTITKSSGTVSSGEESTPRRYKINIGGHVDGTYPLHIHYDSIDASYTFTPADHTDAQTITKEWAVWLTEIAHSAIPGIKVIAEGANGNMYIEGLAGVSLTITDPGGGTGSAITITSIEASAAQDTIRFAAPSSGAMSKDTDTWSGTVATTGVAGYFRIVQSHDDGTDSATQIRLQGSVSTSGAELNLSSTSLVSGTTLTIDTFSVTLPAE